MMTITDFLTQLDNAPDTIQFSDTIAIIEQYYHYTPSAFRNGTLLNQAGENQGSCKIFAFAQLQQLSVTSTLSCFGDYYRLDVLNHPTGNDHQNIRQFMQTGWTEIEFSSLALRPYEV
ncbi:MAG TPA: type III effector [Gammaproteobacteria bacterium]|nr:type III effector [Gammaproteobacteria bacterium]HAU07210.1 type III effector [Gammaproteobacteria bacterium]